MCRNAGRRTRAAIVLRGCGERYAGRASRSRQRRASGWHDTGHGPGSPEAAFIDWLTIGDQAESVCADVHRIRSHPLVPRDIPIYGYIYDVKTGQLVEVPEATRIGAAA